MECHETSEHVLTDHLTGRAIELNALLQMPLSPP